MYKNFAETEFVILDVETTGCSIAGGDRIIEVAALKIRNLKPAETFQSLVNPGSGVVNAACHINGITPELLEHAPHPAGVLQKFSDFVAGSCLVGHNLQFDLNFLRNEFELLGLPLFDVSSQLDTLLMARKLLVESGRHSLQTLAYYFELDEIQGHRALPDVELTAKVLFKLIEIAERRNVTDLDLLFKLLTKKKSAKFKDFPPLISAIEEAISRSYKLNLALSPDRTGITHVVLTPETLDGRGRNLALKGLGHPHNKEQTVFLKEILRLQRCHDG